jgi:hypothetical protein
VVDVCLVTIANDLVEEPPPPKAQPTPSFFYRWKSHPSQGTAHPLLFLQVETPPHPRQGTAPPLFLLQNAPMHKTQWVLLVYLLVAASMQIIAGRLHVENCSSRSKEHDSCL